MYTRKKKLGFDVILETRKEARQTNFFFVSGGNR